MVHLEFIAAVCAHSVNTRPFDQIIVRGVNIVLFDFWSQIFRDDLRFKQPILIFLKLFNMQL